MQKKYLISIVTAATLLCGTSSALTLNQAVDAVVTKNSGIKSKLANYKQEIEAYKIAQSGYYPTVDVDGNIGRETTNSKSTQYKDVGLSAKTFSVKAKQNLFNGFSTQLSIEQANNKVYASAYDYISVANELASSMVEIYFGILKENEILAIEKSNYETHERIYGDIKKRYDSGLGKISDVKEVKSRLSLAYANYIGQEQAFNEKMVQFNALYGDFLDIGAFEKYTSTINVPSTLQEIEERVLVNNPSLKMKEFEIHIARNLMALAKKGYYPKLDFELGKSKSYDQSGIEGTTDTTRAMLQFSYNLYNGGTDDKNLQKSISNILQKQEDFNTKKQDELKKAQLFYVTKMMTEKRMEHLNVYAAASKEKLLSYREEFELGRRSLLDLLGAEDDFSNARKQIIRAGYDYDAAKYKILYSTGELLNTLGIALDSNVVASNNVVSMTRSTTDTLSSSFDLDGDKITDDKDVCFNSSGLSVNAVGCSQSVEKYAVGIKVVAGFHDVAQEKDLSKLQNVASAIEATAGAKKYKIKSMAFLRNKIEGEIEYMWPSGIIVQGVVSQDVKWVEVQKRLGANGEVLGEFKLYISASDIEEI